jgi:hypothetical protein
MLSRAIARGAKVKLWTLGTLPPEPKDVALVTRTTTDAWMNHACMDDGMFTHDLAYAEAYLARPFFS